MGNFAAIVPRHGSDQDCRALLSRASQTISDANIGKQLSSVSTEWSLAVLYSRCNSSGAPIALDPGTGCWLAALGTYFCAAGDNRPQCLLQQHLSEGAERLAHSLSGFFVVIIGDARTQETVVITDLVGSLHLYWRELPQGVALSTSSLTLATLHEVTLDPIGCQEFLETGVLYENRTFYQEIRKFPPSTITTLKDGQRVRQQEYWRPADLAPDSLSAKQASEALWEGLSSTASEINKQYQSVACDVTGGYDSRGVAAAFLAGGDKFSAVVSGPEDSRDVTISRGIARTFDIDHVHYPPSTRDVSFDDVRRVSQLTDGECDFSEYLNVARIHTDLSTRFAISVNGSFGELARGYWWELLIPHTGDRRKLDSSKLARLRYAAGAQSGLFSSQARVDLGEHFQAIIDRTTSGVEAYPNTFQMDITYLRMRMQRWQGRLASSTNRIWPCISPFIFRSSLETMLQTRSSARERSYLIRLMLAKHQPALAAYPLEHGYPAVPATWKTVGRFWPLIPHYAGKVVHKLRARTMRQAEDPTERMRSTLWQTEEVRALLRPSSMKSMAVLDIQKGGGWLESSQKPGFSQGVLWNRLLTLECALSQSHVKG